MAICMVSTSTVRSESPQQPKKKIELTSSDLKLLLVGPIQRGLLFPKPKPLLQFHHHHTLIQHLQISLSLTLDSYFPLAGRLATVGHRDNTISFFIDCNNAGALFVHAIAENLTISDILQPLYVPPIVHSFFPLNNVKNCEGFSNPLLAVQVTELADGIFIGCTVNHLSGDGTTFWNFMNSWSEISLGFNRISKPPVFDNWFRSGSNCTIRLPLSILKPSADGEFILPPVKERVYHFSKEKIADLKAKANTEAGVKNISSLQSVLAHLWRSVTRNRRLESNEEIKFLLQVGVRKRLQPALPDEYFGNAVQVGTVRLKAREVIENGLGHVAAEMNKLVAGYTEEKAKKSLECWIKDPHIIRMREVEKNCLVASSSPRFNVYGNDYGWGKAIAVRSGDGNKSDGKITLYPGVEEGSIDIEACLSVEVLEGMENDSEFMAAFTV